jgi:hypothetical protein
MGVEGPCICGRVRQQGAASNFPVAVWQLCTRWLLIRLYWMLLK